MENIINYLLKFEKSIYYFKYKKSLVFLTEKEKKKLELFNPNIPFIKITNKDKGVLKELTNEKKYIDIINLIDDTIQKDICFLQSDIKKIFLYFENLDLKEKILFFDFPQTYEISGFNLLKNEIHKLRTDVYNSNIEDLKKYNFKLDFEYIMYYSKSQKQTNDLLNLFYNNWFIMQKNEPQKFYNKRFEYVKKSNFNSEKNFYQNIIYLNFIKFNPFLSDDILDYNNFLTPYSQGELIKQNYYYLKDFIKNKLQEFNTENYFTEKKIIELNIDVFQLLGPIGIFDNKDELIKATQLLQKFTNKDIILEKLNIENNNLKFSFSYTKNYEHIFFKNLLFDFLKFVKDDDNKNYQNYDKFEHFYYTYLEKNELNNIIKNNPQDVHKTKKI